MILTYEELLEEFKKNKKQSEEDDSFLFTNENNMLLYDDLLVASEKIDKIIDEFFPLVDDKQRINRSKIALDSNINRENAYFKVKSVRVNQNYSYQYLRNLEKNALLEHILILELAFDYAMNELEQKNKGQYYE